MHLSISSYTWLPLSFMSRLRDIYEHGFEGVEIFAVNDKKKHDPENKSKKVKPGRPGIYLE